MLAEETLFCLHRNKLAEAKALLPETKGEFIPSLVQNFEMVQPSFLIGKPSIVPVTYADISMSEVSADASLAAARANPQPPSRTTELPELFSPIKATVPASPYTPSLFPPAPAPRQPPRSGTTIC